LTPVKSCDSLMITLSVTLTEIGGNMKYITLKMVAESAGVSVNTASRAINNKPDINLETKKRILKVAQELG